MMNSELNNHQTDWLAQAEELNDTEASQVNGGAVQEEGPRASMGGAAQSMQADQSAQAAQMAQMLQASQSVQAQAKQAAEQMAQSMQSAQRG